MPDPYTPHGTYVDGSGGGTPILAAALNNVETGLDTAWDAIVALQLPEATRSGVISPASNLLGSTNRWAVDTTQPLPAALAGALLAVGSDGGTLTLTAAGSDVIGSGSSTTMTVLASEVRTLHCTVAGRWRVSTGNTPLSVTDARYAALDADLTAIAALDAATAGAIASDGSGWIKKTYTQFKTALTLVKADVGLGSVDNTADTAKPVSTAQQTAIDNKQDLDSDLTAIAALDASTAGGIASDGSGWIKKTYTQFKTALSLGNVDNTADTAKPVSTAQLTALNTKALIADVQVFTASGTWTKPTGATVVQIGVVGGGNGGGSGARLASGTASAGGSGGGGAGWTTVTLTAAELSATESVTVGAAGAGGAAITVDSTNGNPGALGGFSKFGTTVRAQANAGATAASGGSTSAGTAGSSGRGTAGGGSGGAGAVGATGPTSGGAAGGNGAVGGGAGGGVSVTPAAFAGGNAGGALQLGDITPGAGTLGGGTGGTGPSSTTTRAVGGGGGGGGGSSITGAGGAGGNGGSYGGGGGGGGSSLNGSASGKGGDGIAGIVVVVTYF